MLLFLAALAALFIAGLVAYAFIRVMGAQAPPTGAMEMPTVLWASTVVVLFASVAAQYALSNVERERQRPFRHGMMAALGLSLLFIAIQLPAMIDMLRTHAAKTDELGMPLYGMVFFLVLVHALHVIGGIIPMAVITKQAFAGRYDHEHYGPVKHVVMYWHFLDGVWLIMFSSLLVLA